METMTTTPLAERRPTWPRSVIVAPAIAAFATAAGCTVLAMVFGGLANFNDISAPTPSQQHWLAAWPIGECALAVAALVALATGLRLAAQRRPAAVAAAAIIPVAVGWLVLTAYLGGLWAS